MAYIYEEKANAMALRRNGGDQKNYIDLFKKSIKIREMRGSRINVENAICYCSIAKYLISSEHFEEAE